MVQALALICRSAVGLSIVVLMLCAAQSASAHGCGRLRDAPPGYTASWANGIRARNLSCRQARRVVRGWLRTPSKSFVTYIRGWRIASRDGGQSWRGTKRRAVIRFYVVGTDE